MKPNKVPGTSLSLDPETSSQGSASQTETYSGSENSEIGSYSSQRSVHVLRPYEGQDIEAWREASALDTPQTKGLDSETSVSESEVSRPVTSQRSDSSPSPQQFSRDGSPSVNIQAIQYPQTSTIPSPHDRAASNHDTVQTNDSSSQTSWNSNQLSPLASSEVSRPKPLQTQCKVCDQPLKHPVGPDQLCPNCQEFENQLDLTSRYQSTTIPENQLGFCGLCKQIFNSTDKEGNNDLCVRCKSAHRVNFLSPSTTSQDSVTVAEDARRYCCICYRSMVSTEARPICSARCKKLDRTLPSMSSSGFVRD